MLFCMPLGRGPRTSIGKPGLRSAVERPIGMVEWTGVHFRRCLTGSREEVAQKIDDETINLSQALLLVQTVRVAEKSNAASITSDQKLEILEQIENKSFQQSQHIIHRELGLKVQQPEKILANGDGSITLTFNLTPD